MTFGLDSLIHPTNAIQAMQADGFQVGTAGQANQDGMTYYYVAARAVAGRMGVGQYTGNGGVLNVDTVGFQPELAFVRRATTSRPFVYKPAATGVNADYGIFFNDYAGSTRDITQLRPLGFQVTSGPESVGSDRANDNGAAYYWVAFGPHPGTTNYRSIGDTATLVGAGASGASVTQSSATVDAPSATWVSSNRGRGDVIVIPCPNPPTCTGGTPYTVASVVSETRLLLTQAYAGTTQSGLTAMVRRQFASPAAWEDCIDGPGGAACPYFPVASASLVADDRSEVGVAYRDTPFLHSASGMGAGMPVLSIDGSTTDSTHTITLTADGINRHHGMPGTGVVLDNQVNASNGAVFLFDDHVTVEWLEVKGGSGATAHGIVVGSPPAANQFNVRYNLVHDVPGDGVNAAGSGNVNLLLANNIIHTTGGYGVYLDPGSSWAGQVEVLNNTVSNTAGGTKACFKGVGGVGSNTSHVLLANNIGYWLAGAANDFDFPDVDPANGWADVNLSSRGNVSSDASANSHNVWTGGGGAGGTVNYMSFPAGDLHLSSSTAIDSGFDLSALMPALDIDGQARPAGAAWDAGADEYNATTSVRLVSFRAEGLDSAVPGGVGDGLRDRQPRLQSLSRPVDGRALGAPQPRPDSRARLLTRRQALFAPRRGAAQRSGPLLSAGGRRPPRPSHLARARVRHASRRRRTAGRGRDAGRGGRRGGRADACRLDPSRGSAGRVPARARAHAHERHVRAADRRLLFARPGRRRAAAVRPRLLRPRRARLPHAPDPPHLDGGRGRPRRPRGVRHHGQTSSRSTACSPRPPGLPRPSRWTTARTRRPSAPVKAAALSRGLYPRAQARVLQTAFQGDVKKAYLEIAPLRLDASRSRLVLARRMLVRVAFDGVVSGETGLGGSIGRRPGPARGAGSERLLARFVSRSKGLHAVSWEDLLAATSSGVPDLASSNLMLPTSAMRLSRKGQVLPFHVEPRHDRFGPGSTLFFLSEGSRDAHTNDAVFELAVAADGQRMALGSSSRGRSGAPATEPLESLHAPRTFEKNAVFLPALLEAEDFWLWDYGVALGRSKTYPFTLSSLVPAGASARLSVRLQGGSDMEIEPDHHLRFSINATPVGETSFDGMQPHSIALDVPASVLLEGSNTLTLESLADTGATASYVYLDRFSVDYPHALAADAGALEGRALTSGVVQATGFSPGSVLIDLSGRAPRWMGRSRSALAFAAEEGHSYLAVSPEAFFGPRSGPPRSHRCARSRTGPTGSSSRRGTFSPRRSHSSTCGRSRASRPWRSRSRTSTTPSAPARSRPTP